MYDEIMYDEIPETNERSNTHNFLLFHSFCYSFFSQTTWTISVIISDQNVIQRPFHAQIVVCVTACALEN